MATYWLDTVLILVSLSAGVGCGGPGTPTTPSGPNPTPTSTPTPAPPAGNFTISGLITAYRAGPLKNASVVRFHCNTFTNPFCTTQTDDQGRYTLSGVTDIADIGAWKTRYQSVWKVGVTQQNAAVDFVLYPEVTIDAHDGHVSDTLNGDELMSGDDVTFGGFCKKVPCKYINFGNFVGREIPVEVRLRWSDSSRRLALYHFTGDADAILTDQRADRYCCTSDVPIRISVSGYFDAVAVGFEEVDGHPPAPSDSVAFEVSAVAVH